MRQVLRFTEDQRNEMLEHLTAHPRFSVARAKAALLRLEVAFSCADSHLTYDSWLNSEKHRREAGLFVRNFKRTARLASELRGLLKWDAPRAHTIEWDGLIGALELLESSAAAEVAELTRAKKRPNAHVWRDGLMRVAAECYPSGAKRGQHLELTINHLLHWLKEAGHPIEDERQNLATELKRAVRRPLSPRLRVMLEQGHK